MTDFPPRPMDLDDVHAYSFGARYQSYAPQFGGPEPKEWTQVSLDMARDAAMEEMMNEQQAMLMAICDKLGIVGGWTPKEK